MPFPRPKKEHYEGFTLVQGLAHGIVKQYWITDDEAARIESGKPVLQCQQMALEDAVLTVVGKVVGGMINGEPLSRWLPGVQ